MDDGGSGGAAPAPAPAPAGGWRFGPNAMLASSSSVGIRCVLSKVFACVDPAGRSPVIPLGYGDPSAYPCFRTPPVAEDAIVDAVRSAQYNGYAPTGGTAPARRALAEYLSRDLPYKLSPDDIFLTVGCIQGIELVISVIARPGANILLPKPGFPFYEARAAFSGLEARYFSLIPGRGWEIDLDNVEAVADENTVAMVIINPCNPCGNVFTYQHLAKVAETARKLGIMVITDEVYGHLTFGSNPFVPMGVFGQTVPVLTLGSISKKWVVPGWRLGWIAVNDTNGIFRDTEIVKCFEGILNISTDPATFIQGAIPSILANTNDDFFKNIITILRQTADLCYDKLKEIDCITCPHKPEGSMFVMVELGLSYLEGISDDVDFCHKLANEESVIILPGCAVGLKNWLRITFAVDPTSLEAGLDRLKSFCKRHAKKNK